MRKAGSKTSWRPILSQNASRRRYGIYAEGELQDLIMYERARADRTGQSFSLVLCGLDGGPRARASRSRAISVLAQSIRHTDHLGWFDRDRLGVILPLTGFDGARRFVSAIREGEPASKAAVDELCFSIHTYPDNWSSRMDRATERVAPTPMPDDGPGCTDPDGPRPSDYRFVEPVPRWKRVLDVVGASLGLLVLSPLFAVVAIYIKAVSPGPVIFRQQRIGRARREFTFLKFRTMHHNNRPSEHSHHLKDLINFDKPMTKLDAVDPRIIPGGRILRKLSIDELPQIINVLKGDMTLVGPRPCIPYEADEYLQWHASRFSVLPGLTGLWQVSGKNKLTFQQMIRLDIEYSRRMSIWFDLLIILRTFPTLVGLALEGLGNRIRRGRDRLARANAAVEETGLDATASREIS